MKLSTINEMPESTARELLADCCGSSTWVREMLQRRPFHSTAELQSVADELWPLLERPDWLEAFAHHPRIGERQGSIAQGARGAAWSADEQGGSRSPDTDNHSGEELLVANREYESRFGHIYIVCATGRTREEMLAIARQRLKNDPDTELVEAAREQMAITRLRLDKLIDEDETR
ncbi:MAG TPA: 2-oxo-4-hydroxy-4-carboxy-5-ureidoimidazoline decarboxylase [Gemmatimonadaceae bacterium]|nr:2-oxo-4-hydroxy-4-carboxy-5-ureidoimidazoline decarboxylase [Gemmatimonadaceae bacterium]